MGELHLEIIIDRLKREFKVEAEVGKPQVAYRETITEPIELWYTHKKQTGGSGQYAKLCMVYQPNPGEGFEFENAVVGGAVPKEYVPAVVKGTEGELLNGIRMGFPVVDVKASLKDGGFHPVDSSAIAFEIAARAAFKEGAGKAKPIVMEPIMKVEVITPEEYMGNIIGDLNSRRGIVNELGTRSNLHVVNASVPLAEMFSYIAELRNLSKGRANYSMEFEKYEPVPENVAETIEAKKWDQLVKNVSGLRSQFSDLTGHEFSVRFWMQEQDPFLAACKDVRIFSMFYPIDAQLAMQNDIRTVERSASSVLCAKILHSHTCE